MPTAEFELDRTYLRATVGAPLTEALAQLAVLQPDDPVDFLGNFLLKHVANAQVQQQRQERQEAHQQQGDSSLESSLQNRASLAVFGSPEDLSQQQKPESAQDLLVEERLVQSQLHNELSVGWVFQRFLEWLCSALDAEEAYIGRKCVNPQGTNVVHIIASSKYPYSTAVDKFVTEPAEEDDGRGRGVTFDVFKEVVPVSADGTPTVDAEGNPLPATPPKFLHMENVLREPRVKFFGVPKLGALLTRAGQYKSYLHADVVNESNPEEPNVLEQWLVFSADTMGQARSFTKAEIERFQRVTELFLTTLEEKERALYMKDNEQRVTIDDPQLREFLVAFAAQVSVQEENLATRVQALGGDGEAEEAVQQLRAAKEAELRLGFLTTLLLSHVPTLAIAAARVVPFKPLVLSTFASTLELLGYSRLELYNPATNQPSWDKMAPLLEESKLKPRLDAFMLALTALGAMTESGDTTAVALRAVRATLPVTAAGIAQAKQTLGELVKSDLDAASPIAACFYSWGQAVIAHAEQLSTAVERAQQLEDDAAAAAAEAAEADA
ncbi:hypothetical protein BBJ28_00006805 [Nothophytophthora sp. Chile5]|nr:hypothetical protein BBJ28_00006805 [Nothophytophthora sp. Chile5]